MKIQMMATNDLIPYANNPRKNDNAVDAVAASIKKFGFKVPIVVDSRNEIVAGHTRLKAAKKLGLDEVPVIVADDLTPEQVKAFRLADNKTGELSDWDIDLLDNELDEIVDIDMGDFGFIDSIEPIDDDEMDTTDITTHVLSIDKIKIELTDDEYADLTERLDKYIDENGVSFGFVRGLLHDS